MEAELKDVDFGDAFLKEANFQNAQFLTAGQLISANNIVGIKNCPQKILDEIEAHGCGIMLTSPSDKWPDDFIKHQRKKLFEFGIYGVD